MDSVTVSGWIDGSMQTVECPAFPTHYGAANIVAIRRHLKHQGHTLGRLRIH